MPAPNEGQVLQRFGKYTGTVYSEGLRRGNPLYTKPRISLRVRTFESAKPKVNDNDGNPIEIGAVGVQRDPGSLGQARCAGRRSTHQPPRLRARITQAMLQRQPAGTIIAASTKIVECTISMVEMALDQLSRRDVVALDEGRKAAMATHLLVVLGGARGIQPVVNTDTFYEVRE